MLPLLLLAAAATLHDPAAAAPARLYRVDHRLEAAADRRDRAVFWSPPDSLRLDARTGECACYRFPDCEVKGSARYRLRFVYLVALGSVGTCRVRMVQYQDHENTWKLLGAGAVERRLTVVGRWQAVVIDFRAEPDATSVAVTFDVESPCDVFEAWVDNCSLAPAGGPTLVGP